MNTPRDAIEKNYGLSILRIWMCFEVVLCHFWIVEEKGSFNLFERTRGLAVPIFFLMSFILTGKKMVVEADKTKFKKRFYRLLCPQIFWSVVYFIRYYLRDLFSGGLDLKNGIKDFTLQLFLGHTINQSMWYQVDLIIITFLLILIFGICKKELGIFILIFLGMLSIYLQYSGWNIATFGDLPGSVSVPLGRMCEAVPFMVIGTLISYYDIMKLLGKKRWETLLLLLAGIVIMFNVTLFVTPEGFGYSGMYNICMGCLIVMLFYFLPLERLQGICKRIIENISKYTLGIYCIHRLVRDLLKHFIYPYFAIMMGTFKECILVFLVSLLIALLIGSMPVKCLKDSVM